MDRIYFDHAGTTPVTEHVLNGMIPYFREIYGNASSIHATGRTARKAVENARRQVQHALGAENAVDIVCLVVLGNDGAVAVIDIAPQRLGDFPDGVGRVGIAAQVGAGAQMDFTDGNQKDISRKDQHRS